MRLRIENSATRKDKQLQNSLVLKKVSAANARCALVQAMTVTDHIRKKKKKLQGISLVKLPLPLA